MINIAGQMALAYSPLQFKNLWAFTILDNPATALASANNLVPGIDKLAATAGAIGGLAGGAVAPIFLTQSISLPFKGLTIENKSSGRKVYQGVKHIDTFSITFLELESLPVLTFLTTWLNTIYDPINNVFKTGKGKSPTKTGILTLFAAEVPDLPTQIFVYEGLRITNIQDIALDYASADPLQITGDFICDKIYPLRDGLANTALGDVAKEGVNRVRNVLQQL